MPRRQPFTALCRQLAHLARPSRADLHVHSTASDGDYTPSQVVALAKQAGLAAVALTDHDTLAGLPEAVAAGDGIRVIPGVEITTQFKERELHLLGYFVRLDDAELNAALGEVRASRRERFRAYVKQLNLPDDRAALVEQSTDSLGRRHVARLLVSFGRAATTDEVFRRHLAPLKGLIPPKHRIPIGDAIRLVHAAGGVASLAHPPPDLSESALAQLNDLGLDAVEADYAWRRSAPRHLLHALAARLGLLTTGGSDCHGPRPEHRRIGSVTIPMDAVARLEASASGKLTVTTSS